MTQADLIEKLLSDGKWHGGLEISNYLVPGGISVAYRSRISCELKPRLAEKGLAIYSRKPKNCKIWEYRIGEQGELNL
jgi:hypothetical protein